MRKFVALGGVLFAALSVVAVAQEQPIPVPKVLVIYREDVKPGRSLAHGKNEAGWAQAVARAKWPEHYIGFKTISGLEQAWFTYGYDSLEAYEKDQAAQNNSAAMSAVQAQYAPADGEYVSEIRTTVVRLVPELVYHPMAASDFRYFLVRTFRTKLGHAPEFMQLHKLANSAFDKAGLQRSSATFAVVAGAPAGTYLMFAPVKSLAEFDTPLNWRELLGADYDEFMALFDKSVLSFSDDYIQVDPKMSYPDARWIKADASGFWNAKPTMAKAAAGDGKKSAAAGAKKDAAKGK